MNNFVLMSVMETLEWADTLMTIGQIVLFIGCPTAGIGWLVGRVALKIAAKKAVAMAAATGVTATVTAFLYMQQNEVGSGGTQGGAGQGPPAPVSVEIRIFEDGGSPVVQVAGEDIELENLKEKIWQFHSKGTKEVSFEPDLEDERFTPFIMTIDDILTNEIPPGMTVKK
jgi:hypothetical protein